ncbi:unnamed protein product, partial [Mesorhabditis spiculigera]
MGGSYAKPKQDLPKCCDTIVEEVRHNPVMIYTTSSCGYCTMAKDLFKEEGIDYFERDIEALHKVSPAMATECVRGLQVITKRSTVPQIFICKDYVGGYDALLASRARLHDMVAKCVPNHKKPTRPQL